MFLPPASRLLFNDDGLRLAVLGDALGVYERGSAIWSAEVPAHSLAWSGAPEVLLVGTTDGHLCWLDPATGAIQRREKVDSGPVWAVGSHRGHDAAMTREGVLHRWTNGLAKEPLELAMRPIETWLGGTTDDLAWIEEGGTAVHWSIDRVHGESYLRARLPDHRRISVHRTDRYLIHPDRVERVVLTGDTWVAKETWPLPGYVDDVCEVARLAPEQLWILTPQSLSLLHRDGTSTWDWYAHDLRALDIHGFQVAVAGPRHGATFSPGREIPPRLELSLAEHRGAEASAHASEE